MLEEWFAGTKKLEMIPHALYAERTRLNYWVHELAKILSEAGHAQDFLSCALSLKGVGSRYHGRIVAPDASGGFPLLPGEVVLDEEIFGGKQNLGPRIPVGFPDLLGREGLFLDQIYQPFSSYPAPIGAAMLDDTFAQALDLEIMGAGGVLGGITFSSLKLLEGKAIRQELGLEEYEGGDLFVVARAEGKDTRRLEEITLDANAYQQYIYERNPDDFLGERTKHLQQLAFNLGCNIHAALSLKLSCIELTDPLLCGLYTGSNGPSRNTIGNLSPEGELFDSSELTKAASLTQTSGLVHYWIKDFYRALQIAGIPHKNFIHDPTFLVPLFHGALGEPVMVLDEGSNARDSFAAEASKKDAVLRLTALLLTAWKKINGGG